MAEVVNTHKIGQHLVRPTEYGTDQQLATLQRYDKALGATGHDRMHYAGPDFFPWDIQIQAQVTGTSDSLPFVAPWPMTIWAADVGVEAISAGTVTLDLFVDPVGVGAAASILDAAEAVAAGAVARVAPEDGSENVNAGDIIFLRAIKAGGGTADGCMAKLYCQRR